MRFMVDDLEYIDRVVSREIHKKLPGKISPFQRFRE